MILKSYAPVPLQLAKNLFLRVWFDSSQLVSLNSASGAVSAWRDQGGFQRNGAQGTAANQPTSGSVTQADLNVVAFDGISDSINVPTSLFPSLTTGSFTMFLVGKSNVATPATNKFFYGSGPGQQLIYLYQNTAGNIIATMGASPGVTLSSSISAQNPFIAMLSSDGTTDLLTLIVNNGVPITNTRLFSAVATTSPMIGSLVGVPTSFLDGWVSEIIIFGNILSATVQLSIFQYLSAKWKIAIS